MYLFPTRGEQTTNATATDVLHGRSHNAQSTLRSKRHSSSGLGKDDRGEVGKFAEWSWFRSVANAPKLRERHIDAHLVGNLNRADEHFLVIKV